MVRNASSVGSRYHILVLWRDRERYWIDITAGLELSRDCMRGNLGGFHGRFLLLRPETQLEHRLDRVGAHVSRSLRDVEYPGVSPQKEYFKENWISRGVPTTDVI